MSDLTLKQIDEQRRSVELTIIALIAGFEASTGVAVTEVNVLRLRRVLHALGHLVGCSLVLMN